MMETLLDIEQNLIIENLLPAVVTVMLVFQSRNFMLMFYDYSLVFCRW